MIGDRARVGVGEAGEREGRLRDLLELRRLRAGLHSPALSAFTRRYGSWQAWIHPQPLAPLTSSRAGA